MLGRSLGIACALATTTVADEPVLVATDGAFGSAMVYHLDPATGRVLEAVDLVGTGPLGLTPLSALAYDGGGHLLGFTPNTDNALYRVDRQTGQATFGGRLGLVAREGGLAVFADGTIYAASTGSPPRLFTINPSTGRATLGPVLSHPTDVSGLGARSDGLLVALDLLDTEGPPALRLIDPATGETAELAPLLPRIALATVGGLEIIERDGVETGYYIIAPDDATSVAQLWRFDPYTGEQVPVGQITGPDGDVGAVTGLAGLPCEACVIDLDGDCNSTIFDFLLLGNWIEAGDARADLDGDGTIDLFDYLLFLTLFDAGC